MPEMSDGQATGGGAVDKLLTALDDALLLLGDFSVAGDIATVSENPASLLDECLELCAKRDAISLEPVRTLHHFACTGGTLLSKCLAVMPNVQLISEIDPLSTMLDKSDGKPRFAPSDMIRLLRQSTRGASRRQILEIFRVSLASIYAGVVRSGQRLVLRDHAHGHYCLGEMVPERPSLRDLVAEQFPVLSVVTVRHPLDSYLALLNNQWLVFSPAGLDEYCRRYLVFLSDHAGVPIVKYEDFVESPDERVMELCGYLGLPYNEDFPALFSAFQLTGDSGRSGNAIARRARRHVGERLAGEAVISPHYRSLLQQLGYDA